MGQEPVLSDNYIKAAVCVIVVSDDNKILITKRQNNMTYPNAWVFPGGHLDP